MAVPFCYPTRYIRSLTSTGDRLRAAQTFYVKGQPERLEGGSSKAMHGLCMGCVYTDPPLSVNYRSSLIWRAKVFSESRSQQGTKSSKSRTFSTIKIQRYLYQSTAFILLFPIRIVRS